MLEERPKLRYLKPDWLELWTDANVRKSGGLTNIEDLANNIAKNGLRVPLLVKKIDERYFKVFVGQRRLTACRMIKLEYVPCFIFEKITLREAQILSLSENLYRQPMNDDDLADASHELLLQMKDREKVAKALGVSVGKVKKYLGYKHVPESIKEVVRSRKYFTPQQAIDIYTKFPDETKATKIAKEMASITSRTKRAKYYHAVKTSSPSDDVGKVRKRAEKLGRMMKYEILLPDVKSKLLEKIAYKREVTIIDVILQIIEQWTDEYERGMHRLE